MARSTLLCRALASLVLVLPAAAVAAEEPASMVLEAEDFRPAPGSAWRPIRYGENYFVDAIGNGYLSGEKLLSAPDSCPPSSASLVARVPRAGRYKVWVHYEAPKDHNTRFSLAIEQAGRRSLDAPMGGAEQIRLWPLGWGYRAQVNPAYGGGDNVTWQGAEVELSAGDATFILATLDNPAPAAKRNIDVIYVTSDLSDQPKNRTDPFLDDLLRPGRLWLRVRNTGEKSFKISAGVKINRRNWRIEDRLYQRSGLPALREKEIPPGGTSEWTDLGTVMDTIHGTTLELSPGPRAAFGGAVVEIAHQPDAADRWSCRWESDELPLIIWVPVDLDLKGIVTSDQMNGRIREYVKDRPAGPAPRRIKFYSRFGGGEMEGRHAKWWDLYYAFGYSGPGFGLNKPEPGWERIFGGDPNRKGLSYSHLDPHTDLARLRQVFSDPAYKPVIDRLEAYSIGDEINLGLFGDADDAMFRENLKARGFTPERLGVKDWSQVRMVGQGQAAERPVLYVESHEFGLARAIASLKALTGTLREAFGRDVPIGANYAPHPIYLPEEAQWVDAFREGALTLPWAEDYAWQVPIASPQIIGWVLDVMRCGAKYHDLPIMFYCMPHSPGNTSTNFRLSNYLALGRGVKYIHHFVNGPQPFSTENYVDWRDRERYRQIWDVIHEAGKVDELLYAGKPPRAETAVLMCRYTDLWERPRGPDGYNLGGDNPNSNAYGIERQGLWLAAKHAQAPVDLLTEYDLRAGGLSGYRVLYLAGSHVSREAAKRIAEWVAKGGVLFSSAAGGLSDEYDRPNDALLPVYGIASHTFVQKDRCIRPKMELAWMKPMDSATVELDGRKLQMEALAVIDRVTVAPGAEVLGRFSYGGPAVLRKPYGKGTAYLVNTMPGLAYTRAAIPARPFDRNEFANFLPRDYSADVRALISAALRQAGVMKRVECSEPLVEGDLLESPPGVVIALTNFSGRPVGDLHVTVRLDRAVSRMWSVRLGTLEHRAVQGGWEVRMPLEVADFLVLE